MKLLGLIILAGNVSYMSKQKENNKCNEATNYREESDSEFKKMLDSK